MKINKNSHTISTKCQYQDAASNLKWWFFLKCPIFIRIKFNIKKIVPIRTCRPWKPVSTKKVVPYTESEIVKVEFMYSDIWRIVK